MTAGPDERSEDAPPATIPSLADTPPQEAEWADVERPAAADAVRDQFVGLAARIHTLMDENAALRAALQRITRRESFKGLSDLVCHDYVAANHDVGAPCFICDALTSAPPERASATPPAPQGAGPAARSEELSWASPSGTAQADADLLREAMAFVAWAAERMKHGTIFPEEIAVRLDPVRAANQRRRDVTRPPHSDSCGWSLYGPPADCTCGVGLTAEQAAECEREAEEMIAGTAAVSADAPKSARVADPEALRGALRVLWTSAHHAHATIIRAPDEWALPYDCQKPICVMARAALSGASSRPPQGRGASSPGARQADAETERAAIANALPPDWYAGRALPARVALLTAKWQKAVAVIAAHVDPETQRQFLGAMETDA